MKSNPISVVRDGREREKRKGRRHHVVWWPKHEGKVEGEGERKRLA